jgi:hypothetical protein
MIPKTDQTLWKRTMLTLTYRSNEEREARRQEEREDRRFEHLRNPIIISIYYKSLSFG